MEYHYPTSLDALARDQQQATEDGVEALEYLASILTGKEATIKELVYWLNAQGPTTDIAGCGVRSGKDIKYSRSKKCRFVPY